MSQDDRNPFNSPIPKRFLQGWTSPLIAGLTDAASFEGVPSKTSHSSLVMTPVEGPPLRERSFAESISSNEAEVIKSWLECEEEKSEVDSASFTPSPDPQGPSVFKPGSPSALGVDDNKTTAVDLPPLHGDPFGGSFKFYEASSPGPAAVFSPMTSKITTPKSSEKRAILADISATSTVEFVPISWTTLYHCRPFEDESDENKVFWLREVSTHFRPSPSKKNEDSDTTTPAPLNVTVHSANSSQFSPVSMPSAIQTGSRPTTTRSIGLASVRSILKSGGSDANAVGRGQRGVRFDYPLTSVKRPIMAHATPTTWPYAVLPPDRVMNTSTDNLFRDIWDETRPGGDKENFNNSWIPYQTPESTSTGSSSSREGGGGGLDDNQSSESKTTVMITGKENSRAGFASTTTKSNEGSAKSHSSRPTPFTGKKLSYERSSSERNIMKALE